MAKGDIGMCVGCLRYYGGWADKIEGKTVDTTPDTFNYIKKEPIGVCGQIIRQFRPSYPRLFGCMTDREQLGTFLCSCGRGRSPPPLRQAVPW